MKMLRFEICLELQNYKMWNCHRVSCPQWHADIFSSRWERRHCHQLCDCAWTLVVWIFCPDHNPSRFLWNNEIYFDNPFIKIALVPVNPAFYCFLLISLFVFIYYLLFVMKFCKENVFLSLSVQSDWKVYGSSSSSSSPSLTTWFRTWV